MKTHELTLHDAPFHLIKEGKKTIEMRLNDAKRRLIMPGDRVVFIHRLTGEKLLASVLKIDIFKDFEALYQHVDHTQLGYEKGQKVSFRDMEIYYSPEQIMDHGVLAITIKSESSENI